MKTVLFAWELGHGLGHIMNIRRAAARLKPHGIRIVVALKSSTFVDVLSHLVDTVMTAPAWPVDMHPGSRQPAPPTTFNDVLCSAGLADDAAVRRLLAAWDKIFSQCAPDLIVGDFSPLAALAAQDRIPLVLIGNGYTLPPHEMGRFPPLQRHSPPVWDETRTLETVNKAAREFGRKPLSRLPQLFQGDANLVQTFPLLDPYDTQRPEHPDCPVFEYEPRPKNFDAETIFVYLSAGYEPHPHVFLALEPLAKRLRLYAPAMPWTQQEALRDKGTTVDIEPPRISGVLPSSCLVVHNGGSGVAAEALAGGVPQVVLSAQIEQDLNGTALERAGAARLVKMYAPGAIVSPALIKEAAENEVLAQRAAELGQWHRARLKSRNALLQLEETCLLLLAS